MKETIEIKEPVEQTEPAVDVKPYTLRKLASTDMFLMFKIIGKIGLNEFKACVGGDTIKTLMSAFTSPEGEGKDSALTSVGIPLAFDIANVIFNNLPKCENEIYQLLAQVSGMSVDEIKNDAILFTEMVIDFVKKEEFPAFIKVVSKSFK